MKLPMQKGLIDKKPSFFKNRYILFTETYGDDLGMGSFKVHHWKKEDGEIYLYDKDDDRYCTLDYAKSYMLTTDTGKLTDEIKKISKKDKLKATPQRNWLKGYNKWKKEHEQIK